MRRPLSETAWLRKIGTQDSKRPLSSRSELWHLFLAIAFLHTIFSYLLMLPGVPFCILANGFFNVSRIQQFQNYLQGVPLQRNWFYLFFWSNTAPCPFCDSNLEVVSNQNPAPGWSVWIGEVFCQYTWKTVKFRSLQSSGNDPIRWSVMIDLKCLLEFSRQKALTHKEGFHRFACTESVITPLRLGKYMDVLRSKSKSYVNRCCLQAPGHDSWLELHSILQSIQFIRKPWLRWCTMKLNCNHSASQWRCELRDTLPTHFCGASSCFQVWDF